MKKSGCFDVLSAGFGSRFGNPEREFAVLGRRWILLDGVFSPIENPVTELFTTWLPYPVGGSFLEIGCGAGVTAVHASLSGCRHVVAVDINEAAIDNTRRNAERHGVSDRISVRYSDLYEALDPDERFDVIFWNSNFIDAPDDHFFQSDLDYAYFDPGYRVHRRYLQGLSRTCGMEVACFSASVAWGTGMSSGALVPKRVWSRQSCEARCGRQAV